MPQGKILFSILGHEGLAAYTPNLWHSPFLLLVVMPLVTSSFLLLVAMAST